MPFRHLRYRRPGDWGFLEVGGTYFYVDHLRTCHPTSSILCHVNSYQYHWTLDKPYMIIIKYALCGLPYSYEPYVALLFIINTITT